MPESCWGWDAAGATLPGGCVVQRGRPQEREDGERYQGDQCRTGDATAVSAVMAVLVAAGAAGGGT